MADTMGAQAKHPPLLHTNAICKLASVRREQPVALAKHMFSCWRHPARKASVPPGFCRAFGLHLMKQKYYTIKRRAAPFAKYPRKCFRFAGKREKMPGNSPAHKQKGPPVAALFA